MNKTIESAKSIITLRSGGQTGVDRAALDVAIAKNIPYSGWCPKGGWAEDLQVPPGLLSRYDRLAETPSEVPEQRTAWNVRDSNATLIILEKRDTNSKGTSFARVCAELIFLRPWFVACMEPHENPVAIRMRLNELLKEAGSNRFDLNVAGPRESESPGIYALSYRFLSELF